MPYNSVNIFKKCTSTARDKEYSSALVFETILHLTVLSRQP